MQTAKGLSSTHPLPFFGRVTKGGGPDPKASGPKYLNGPIVFRRRLQPSDRILVISGEHSGKHGVLLPPAEGGSYDDNDGKAEYAVRDLVGA